jgi:hypothetical protein
MISGIILLFTSGCYTHRGNLNLVTTKNIDLKKKYKYVKIKEGVVGKKFHTNALLILGSGFPDMQEAIADALDKSGGDIMKNVEVYQKSGLILFPIIWRDGYKVKGDVYKLVPLSKTDDHNSSPHNQNTIKF